MNVAQLIHGKAQELKDAAKLARLTELREKLQVLQDEFDYKKKMMDDKEKEFATSQQTIKELKKFINDSYAESSKLEENLRQLNIKRRDVIEKVKSRDVLRMKIRYDDEIVTKYDPEIKSCEDKIRLHKVETKEKDL